jgi:hypothetical protein
VVSYLAECFSAHAQATYSAHLRDGELRGWTASTPLCRHVAEIVYTRAKEQVLRIYARANIAAMAHIKAAWYFTKDKLVHNAMCAFDFAADVKNAITIVLNSAHPYPATIRHYNVFELILDRLSVAFSYCLRATNARAVTSSTYRQAVRVSRKRSSAMTAFCFN